MSAIGGILGFGRRPVAGGDAERMSNSLSLFGPDRHAIWAAPDQRLALVWRQFSVLPEDAVDRQPLRSTDGVHTLVADARIDNIDEFAAELDLPTTRGLPDAAILLSAYRKWGAACLDRLVGEFAFAVWDSREETLFLARDALGYRPLFWTRRKELFGFASMPRGLFALPDVSRAIDERNLAGQLALLPPSTDGTIFREINRVPPGHCMTVSRSGQETRRYWTPQPERHGRFRDPRDSAEALLEVYSTAVRCRLRGIGGVGSMISAGWDSTSVTAIAARMLAGDGRGMTSFTAVPREGFAGPTLGGRIADESEIAARVLRDFPNVEHIRVSSATRSHLAEIEAQSRYQDLPVQGPINSIWINRIAAEAKARGIRVLLGGDHGNLTVSYNGHGALPLLFRQGRWPALARLLAQRFRSGHKLRSDLNLAIGPFVPDALYSWLRRIAGRETEPYIFHSTALSAELASAVDIHAMAAERGWETTPRPSADGWQIRVRALGRTDAAHARVAMNARFGIDPRDPTIDRRVVELCLAIPEEHFLYQGRESAVFRLAMAGVLPDWLLAHRNRGLQSADWYEGLVAARDELAEHVERLATSQTGSRALDIARLRKVIAALPDPSTPPEELAKDRWGSAQAQRTYGAPLLRAINIGHFIMRTEGSNR